MNTFLPDLSTNFLVGKAEMVNPHPHRNYCACDRCAEYWQHVDKLPKYFALFPLEDKEYREGVDVEIIDMPTVFIRGLKLPSDFSGGYVAVPIAPIPESEDNEGSPIKNIKNETNIIPPVSGCSTPGGVRLMEGLQKDWQNFKKSNPVYMGQSVKCMNPHCNCIEIAEAKAGGPVKNYPCLAAPIPDSGKGVEQEKELGARLNYDNIPKGRVLIKTISKMWFIADWYNDGWRIENGCPEWVDGKRKTMPKQDVTHYCLLPDDRINEPMWPEVRDVKLWPPDKNGEYWCIVKGIPSALGQWLMRMNYNKEEGGFLQEDDHYRPVSWLTYPILSPSPVGLQEKAKEWSGIDLQDQIKDHIRQYGHFDWDEALTGQEMEFLVDLLLTFHPSLPPGSIGLAGASTRPQGSEVKELLDCIHNLMALVDTPLGRRQNKGELADSIRKEGQRIMEKYGRKLY